LVRIRDLSRPSREVQKVPTAEVGQVAVMFGSSCLLRQPMRCFVTADGRPSSKEQRHPMLLTRQYSPVFGIVRLHRRVCAEPRRL
jgi:hypothetical protein